MARREPSLAAGRAISMRRYKSGTAWCIWRWTYQPEADYVVRLHVIQTRWFGVYLHWINHPDVEPYLHDHPRSFLSQYEEERAAGRFRRRWFNLIRATDQHSIKAVMPGTVTLCFMGPVRQVWGFFTPSGKVPWKQYYKKPNLPG
jgi:hypothetical protein